MSGTDIKFCEECGGKNIIEALFCKKCGKEFPEIDDPRYLVAKNPNQAPLDQPASPVKPPQYAPPGTSIDPNNQKTNPNNLSDHQQPPIQQQGPLSNYPLSGQQPPVGQKPPASQHQGPPSHYPPPGMAADHYSQQMGMHPPYQAPTRVWTGNGLLDAAFQFHKNPSKTTPELVEDQNSPNPIIFVLLIAVLRGIATYFSYIKVEYTSVDPDVDFANTTQAVEELAITSAFSAVIGTLFAWYVGSWLMALIMKNGFPRNSYIFHNTSKSMRSINAFRYAPILIYQIVYIILIQLEGNRVGKIEGTEMFGITQPTPVFESEFSSTFLLITIVLQLIIYAYSAVVFYRGTKDGLRHQGVSPILFAVFILITPFISGLDP